MPAPAPPAGSALPISWIAPLARPYLRGYRPAAEARGSLRGYWFLRPGSARPRALGQTAVRGAAAACGFFVGYLVRAEDFAFLAPPCRVHHGAPLPPECLVFAFVLPVGAAAHRRLVQRPGSLLRATSEYIHWLTHRPPRFVFFEGEIAALARHFSMRDWPRVKYRHYAGNFFMETLAWLVRSGLVRKLLVEAWPAKAAAAPAKLKFSPPKSKSRLGRKLPLR